MAPVWAPVAVRHAPLRGASPDVNVDDDVDGWGAVLSE